MDMLEKLDGKFDRMHDDMHNHLDKLHEELSDIKNNTTKNTISLEHHIKRTDDLQDLVTTLEKGVCDKVDKLEKDSIRVKMIWKVILGISTLSGLVLTFVKLL